MASDPRIGELLSSWHARHERGESVSVEDLCHECPELASELYRLLSELKARESSSSEQRPQETIAEANSASETPSVEDRPADKRAAAECPPTAAATQHDPRATADAKKPGGVVAPGSGKWMTVPGYEIQGELGRGGMGVVYKARQIGLNRTVAIKMIITGANAGPRERARFYAEAEAVAKLQHPNIVQIYEINETDGCPYFSLEFVEGESLYKRTAGVTVDPLDAAALVEMMAMAMDYAHQRGVIHRDLKPANILLSAGAAKLADSNPKITDFGLARQLEHDVRLTQTGIVIGTPCYMAPEQVENPSGDVGPAVDIYGLGALLYELLTARPPFCADTNFETMRQVVAEDAIPPSKLHDGVPAALDRICMKCLEKDPADRYQTAQALAEDLALFLDGKRPSAAMQRPSSARKRPSASSGRWQPESRGSAIYWQLGAVAILALALVGFGAFSLSHLRSDRLREAEHTAQANLIPAQEIPGGKLKAPIESDLLPAGVSPVAIPPVFTGPPIKVGVLHSLTGTMRISESAVVDATLLAISELNEQGGLLGRKIEAIVADGESDPATFAREAERLINEEHVCTVFGCWTSASRKEVLPIFETNNHLLVYPVPCEGLEQSANILYVGAAPNQQIIPAVKWCYAFLERRRFFLVGSDYVFPRVANEIIKDELKTMGGEVVGESYVPLGSTDLADVIRQIKETKPDVILNTINGDTNVSFFRGLKQAGIRPSEVPVVSFSIGETELRNMNTADVVGNYSAQNYFQSINSAENTAFLEKLHARFGPQRVAGDPMEAAYVGVKLWAKAVLEAGTDDVVKTREALPNESIEAPSGRVEIDPTLLNSKRISRIGRVQANGQFEIIASSGSPVPPVIYPKSRTKEQWEDLLQSLYQKWDGHWEAPHD